MKSLKSKLKSKSAKAYDDDEEDTEHIYTETTDS